MRKMDRHRHCGLRVRPFTPGRVRWLTILCFGLGAALLGACAPRPIYYTPTPVPTDIPVPTATPIVATAVSLPAATSEPVEQAGPTMLRIEPSMASLQVGETRQIELVLDNVEQLASIEVHVSFEPGYVNVEDADPGAEGVQIEPGIMPLPGEITVNEVNNEAGLILYHATGDPDQAASTSGVVASFTIRALAEGGSPLRLTVVRPLDGEGRPIDVPTQIDGLVSVRAGAGATGEPPAATAVGPTAAAGPPVEPSPVPSPVPTVPPAGDSSGGSGVYHTVQPGENLYRIALRYGTTVAAIVAANDLPNENSIQAGQTILIPVASSTGQVTYVVQRGDTLFSIARRFGKTVDELAALNGIDSSYAIRVGQTLIIEP